MQLLHYYKYRSNPLKLIFSCFVHHFQFSLSSSTDPYPFQHLRLFPTVAYLRFQSQPIFRSFIKLPDFISGYSNFTRFSHRFRFQQQQQQQLSMASDSSSQSQSIYDFTVKDARGNDVDLSTYKGKVLLIVNVASQCGLTNSNYTELTQLYEKYKGEGLEILAFPCNQFGNQEPGNNEEIVEFACTRFKAEYPIFDKVDVNGDNAAPIYKYLRSSKGGLFGDGIKWNFTKFLVDREGKVVERYAPTTSPSSMEKDLKKLLGVE